MRCNARGCDKTAEYGYTTCKKHRHLEKTIARYGERVAIDYTRTGWPPSKVGSHGKWGKLIGYYKIPADRKSTASGVNAVPTTSHIYGLVDIDGEGKQYFMWEWIVPEADFEKLSSVHVDAVQAQTEKYLREVRDEQDEETENRKGD